MGVDLTDDQMMFALLIGTVGAIGLITAIKQPVTGFIITGGTVLAGIIAITVNLKKLFDDSLGEYISVPNLRQRVSGRRKTLFWGAVALLGFIPFFTPSLLLAFGILVVLYGVANSYLKFLEEGDLTEHNIFQTVLILSIAVTFFVGYSTPELVLLPIAAVYTRFIWTLIPETQQEKVMEMIK